MESSSLIEAPTHVEIFGTFMRIVQELQFQLKLRVYHEVSVLAPDEQVYESINCHAKTGLLNAMGGSGKQPACS